MPPEDYAELATLLPGEVRVLDAYQVWLTGPIAQTRAWLLAQGRWESVRLVGHSAGGAAALEWLFTFPDEVESVALLDCVDPNENPAKFFLPGKPLHRVVDALLWAAGGWPWLARRLAHWGRGLFWGLFTKTPDPLSSDDIERIWGNRAGLRAVWHQVFDRYNQEARVRNLWDSIPSLPEGVPIVALHSDSDAPYQKGLAQRLRAKVIPIDGDHLFPTLLPTETAAVLVENVKNS